MNKTLKITSGILLLLFICPLVSAFGVSTSYFESKPLYMYPGQTIETTFSLQNMAGYEDLTLKATVFEGEGIIELLDSNPIYYLPFPSKGIDVPVRISIPADTELGGKVYTGIMLTEVRENKGKMIQISGAIGSKIPVIIKTKEEVLPTPAGPKPTALPSNYILLAGLAALVVIGAAYYIKKKKFF